MQVRGPCPDSLASEVYKRALTLVRRRFAGVDALYDAVGEAYTLWLAGVADKTAHSAGEHAFYLSRTVATMLFGGAHNRRAQDLARKIRGLRSIASRELGEDADDDSKGREENYREALYRAHYGLPDPLTCEEEVVDALDAIRARTKEQPWRTALRGLFAGGWTQGQVADRLGISYTTLMRWLAFRTPHFTRRAEIVALHASGALPEVAISLKELRTCSERRPPPPCDAWKADMEILAARGWTSYRLSKQLGCKRDTARNWATGENAPGDTYRAALRALVEAGTSETPREKANSELVETFLACAQMGPVTTLQHRSLTRHALERLVRQGVAQRVEVVKEGQRKRDKSRYANPKILVVYARVG